MSFQVNLFPEKDTIWTDAWENFETEVWFNSTSTFHLNDLLKDWKCKVVPGNSGYIEFETEKDALFFLMRWS